MLAKPAKQAMPLKPLTEPDAKHLLAAEGWLELGNAIAANDELENITPLMRAHPEVLECRLQIFIAAKQWDSALAVAETLTEQMPGRPAAWMAIAECLQQKGDTEGAYEALAEVGEQFAEHPEVTYKLAVLAALIGQTAEAEDWLERALDVGGPRLKLKALEDPTLKEFWQKIGERTK